MGLYNVIQPCEAVFNGAAVQFVRPTEEFQPVEIDDDAAAPLVAEGKLSPYAPGGDPTSADESPAEQQPPAEPPVSLSRPRRPRRGEGDTEG